MINLIWAMDENWLVGNSDKLPWHIKEDLEYFKKMTNNQIVLMGDLTYKSMKSYYKNKKFPFKKIYVANLNDESYSDAILIKDVITFLKNTTEDIFVIGGASIYKLSLPYANTLYITYVLNRYKGDIYFPYFDLSNFKLVTYNTSNQIIFTKYERVENR